MSMYCMTCLSSDLLCKCENSIKTELSPKEMIFQLRAELEACKEELAKARADASANYNDAYSKGFRDATEAYRNRP